MIVPPHSPPGPCAPAQSPDDAAVSTLGHDRPQSPSNIFLPRGGTGQAEEFNHAIQYLNKIKLHYTDDEATYNNFLELLQTYQEDQWYSHDVRLPFVALLVQVHQFRLV